MAIITKHNMLILINKKISFIKYNSNNKKFCNNNNKFKMECKYKTINNNNNFINLNKILILIIITLEEILIILFYNNHLKCNSYINKILIVQVFFLILNNFKFIYIFKY